MQQREEEKKTEGKKQAEWIQEFKELRYQWDMVYRNGKSDAMWADGVTLNHIREEMLKTQSGCHAGISQDDIPTEMPKDYMWYYVKKKYKLNREKSHPFLLVSTNH